MNTIEHIRQVVLSYKTISKALLSKQLLIMCSVNLGSWKRANKKTIVIGKSQDVSSASDTIHTGEISNV